MSTAKEQPSKRVVDELSMPSPRQQVSNRSILRIQQLSDALRSNLNETPLFSDEYLGQIKQVLFVSRDYRFEYRNVETDSPVHEDDRWYNFRLTAKYDFSDNDKRWILANKHLFKPLFVSAKRYDKHTSASYQTFLDGVQAWADPESPLSDPTRKAVDQLFIALAVLPYRGVLPSLFEIQFGLDSPLKSDDNRTSSLFPSCFLFRCAKKNEIEFLPFHKFSHASLREWLPPQAMEALKFDQELEHEMIAMGLIAEAEEIIGDKRESATICGITIKRPSSTPELVTRSLIEGILRFTRGVDADCFSTTQTVVGDNPDKDLRGLVIPAYDVVSKKPGITFCGGMVGWIVILLEKDLVEDFQGIQWPDKRQKDNFWVHFTHLYKQYVLQVRESIVSDLLEDYSSLSESRVTPIDFFKCHIHQVIGWASGVNAIRPVDEANQHSKDEAKLEIPLPDGNLLELAVEKIRDTVWKHPLTKGEERSFPPGTRRLCRIFLDELCLIHDARDQGRSLQAHRQFGYVGHETGRIINSITQVPTWLLPAVKSSLLTFALPAFVSLNETHKNGGLQPLLFGRDPQVSFEQWIKGLIRIAAQIETFAQSATSDRFPKTAEARDFVRATHALTAKFRVEHTNNGLVFSDWKYRVYWGAVVLCALRNALKHCFKATPGQMALSYVCEDRESLISVFLQHGEYPYLILENLRVVGIKKNSSKKQTDGSAGAMNYYLEKLYEAADVPAIERRWCTIPEEPDNNGVHRTEIPIPTRALLMP